MTALEQIGAIVRREADALDGFAAAEQRRQIENAQARPARGPEAKAEQLRTVARIDATWEQIRLWLLYRRQPDDIGAAIEAAGSIAAKARAAWDSANGGRAGHAMAAHWLALIVIDRDLRNAFAHGARQERAAA